MFSVGAAQDNEAEPVPAGGRVEDGEELVGAVAAGAAESVEPLLTT